MLPPLTPCHTPLPTLQHGGSEWLGQYLILWFSHTHTHTHTRGKRGDSCCEAAVLCGFLTLFTDVSRDHGDALQLDAEVEIVRVLLSRWRPQSSVGESRTKVQWVFVRCTAASVQKKCKKNEIKIKKGKTKHVCFCLWIWSIRLSFGGQNSLECQRELEVFCSDKNCLIGKTKIFIQFKIKHTIDQFLWKLAHMKLMIHSVFTHGNNTDNTTSLLMNTFPLSTIH